MTLQMETSVVILAESIFVLIVCLEVCTMQITSNYIFLCMQTFLIYKLTP